MVGCLRSSKFDVGESCPNHVTIAQDVRDNLLSIDVGSMPHAQVPDLRWPAFIEGNLKMLFLHKGIVVHDHIGTFRRSNKNSPVALKADTLPYVAAALEYECDRHD